MRSRKQISLRAVVIEIGLKSDSLLARMFRECA